MAKKVTTTYTDGSTTEQTVPNDNAARPHEEAAFTNPRIVSVDVTDTNDTTPRRNRR